MSFLPVIWSAIGFLVGWLINYLADVLPIDRKIQKPVCLQCGSNLPVGDYLLLRGCGVCGKRRSVRSLIVLLIFTALGPIMAIFPPTRLSIGWALALLGILGLIVVIDIEHRLILHVVSLAGAVFCFILGLLIHGVTKTIIGGVAGFLIMLAIYFFGEIFSKVMAKIKGQTIDEVALGFGDVNLSGVLGLLLGWPGILACLFGAILIGGSVSGIYLLVMYLLRRYKLFTALPYAPFLIVSAIYLLFRPT